MQYIIAGYPGSVASYWQMTGQGWTPPALMHYLLFITSMSPLDQYLARFPDCIIRQNQQKMPLWIQITH